MSRKKGRRPVVEVDNDPDDLPTGKGSAYHSEKTGKTEMADSSYELRRFIALDKSELVKSWTKQHGIRIPYRIGRGKHRRYNPDILVEMSSGKKVLEEIKGRIFRPREFTYKNAAAAQYCVFSGMKFRIIFEKDLDEVGA